MTSPTSSFSNHPPSEHIDHKDALSLLALAAILFLYGSRYVNFHAPPAEDAGILMRYAQHMAGGHGIVWNVGERPVDGATDFLFMIAVAGLSRLGLPVIIASRRLLLASHALIVLLIYLTTRKLHRSSRWMALFLALYFALGPGFRYVEALFAAPFFAFAAAISFWFADQCRRQPASQWTMVGFAGTSLVLGLIRPEGVLLAALMLLGNVVAAGFRNARKLVYEWSATYAVLGGAYLLWRWSYFGYLLPNAFYVKGGWRLHPDGLALSIHNVLYLCLPFLPVLFLGLFSSPRTRRETLFTLIPLAGFTASWALMSADTNFEMRFQYALLPLVLITWPALLTDLWEDWKLPRWDSLPPGAQRRAWALVMVTSAIVLLWQFRGHKNRASGGDCNLDIALVLRDYQAKGYGIATTENGLVPLYSNLRALDTYGINDRELAHGADLSQRLDEFRPQIIQLHYSVGWETPFQRMVRRLKNYADQRDYRLAAAFGSDTTDIYYYYVQAGLADSDEISRRILAAWKSDPQGNFDFSTFKLPQE